MEEQTIFLFDVDGVLLHPAGYKEALRSTLDYFAAAMGQPPTGLTYDEIAVFEACGMTNEWLSGAMCLGAMLVGAGDAHPDCVGGALRDTLAALQTRQAVCARPDFAAIAREMRACTPEGVHTAQQVIDFLRGRAIPALHPILGEMLDSIHPPGAPFSLIFQHYTLGHRHFEEVYGVPSLFETEGYLATRDRPDLLPETKARLEHLLKTDHCRAVIYTARPSRPPQGLSGEELAALPRHEFAPEGDMAAEMLGLAGAMPLIGAGRMFWLAARRGRPLDGYIKPSPVQALAAIAAARAHDERAGLESAAALAEDGLLIGPLAQLAGERTRVVIFEDSAGGMLAGRRAVERLLQAGIDIRLEEIGVAQEPSKREALAPTAHRLVSDINEALAPYLDSSPDR